MFRRLFATLLFAALVCGSGDACLAANLQETFAPAPALSVVPDFLYHEAGIPTEHKLSAWRGHWVLLNLWATWCEPCVKEMAALDQLQTQMAGQNLTILALSEDRQGDVAVPSFFKRHRIHHLTPVLDTEGHAPNLLHAAGLPASILIDPEGQEKGRVSGALDWAAPENAAYLKQLITR